MVLSFPGVRMGWSRARRGVACSLRREWAVQPLLSCTVIRVRCARVRILLIVYGCQWNGMVIIVRGRKKG
jgi:hypothetical protein